MKLLQVLPGSRREPHGLEWRIFKRLPWALAASTAIPLLLVLFSTWFGPEGDPQAVAKHLTSMKILAVALAVTGWTAVFTVAIGCAVVWLMKGPAYVADRYEVSDADAPRRSRRD
jgi:ABC-type Fe3+ transport system permease subunit